MNSIDCTNCRQPYPDEGLPYRCPRCGGLFDFAGPIEFDPAKTEPGQPGIWRYRHCLSLPEKAPVITLGEGNTPLVWAGNLAFKCEYLNPSGSFKDRGFAPLMSFFCLRNVDTAIEDSSGNAGASFAAYAARARINGRVFIPDSASGPKRQQIEAYGAEVVRILGPRSNASEAVRAQADKGIAYASHAYLPFILPGYATAAFEIVEQLGSAPGALVVPVGQGGFLLGLGRGFEAMQHAGLIKKVPVLVGVQARACAPLWALYSYGPTGLSWSAEGQTIAEGIRVNHPLRGDAVIKMLSDNQGMLLAVDDDEILKGQETLAHLGFYVEPTSAVVWAAIEQVAGDLPKPVVAVLTGSGLKWTKT